MGGGLILVLAFVLSFITTEASTFLGNMMLPAGADSGASTSFPKLEWETALSLSPR